MIDPVIEDNLSNGEQSDNSEEDEPKIVITDAHENLLIDFSDDRKVNPSSITSEIGQQGKLGFNILHLVVYRSPHANPKLRSKFYKLPFSDIRPLLDEILKQHPDLLSQKDETHETPLNRAVTRKKWQHLNYFLKCERALASPSRSGKPSTSLLDDLVHALMKRLKQQFNKNHESLSSTTTRAASKDPFDEWFWKCIDQLTSSPMQKLIEKPREDSRDTALHLAVAYCNIDGIAPESQITLIHKLLGACPDQAKKLNAANLSPYQHRVRTRGEAIKNAKGRKGDADSKAGNTGRNQTSIARRGTNEMGANTNRTACNTDVNAAGPDLKQRAEVDQIDFLLKDHYMNYVDREEAAVCLYGAKGKSAELAMEFDLSEHSHTGYRFSSKSAKILKNHLKFDSILRYVDLPKITVESRFPKEKLETQHVDGTGRRDLEEIFNWLREDCGVEKIIRVKVDDTKDTPHSDESIENCLKGFQIQVWDWNKTDLCCSTIAKAAPDVREVHLYCSGNNAVLRSWSATDGLRMLKKLETLHVRIEQGLESLEKAHAQLETFKERLKKQIPTLKEPVDAKVIPWSKNKVKISKSQGKTLQAQGELWVSHINDFVNFVVNLVEDKELSPKPVKVALIDDGVDGTHWRFGENIKDGISFCTSSGSEKHVYDYWVPSGCHGTQMASLIHNVCPQVELYVARLQDGEVGSERRIDAASAVKAIDWAVEREVDIISMSWTFELTEKNQVVLEQHLTDAVKRAAAKKILMFCSTGDKGKYKSGQIFPACLDDVFRIGAAKASGKERDETEIDSHYLLPGEDLQTESPSYIEPCTASPVSGSSLATALASGLAALLLYCIDQNDNKELRETAKLRHRMVAAFNRMSGGGTGPRYLKVWEQLRPEFKERYRNDSAEGKQKLKEVMEGLFQ